ncbi:CPBP family intramembrane metalloprotease [Enterococcus faecalis]|uniref:CPBP family intramembrane glutamic endopeptidase n=1 Tax=Enterococcus faecalis TaxID=1351 RepID=UPI002090A565|nr:CPBP family intramembrane glutamic endopeptidase [Enterococcus faecalis]MCO5432973.1 CPBP family intramembrane metalloprotease [Enterococcus faecalis]MCO5480965.1 CPBP family intramembrane metalloprotease [Enterococcus faecalis]
MKPNKSITLTKQEFDRPLILSIFLLLLVFFGVQSVFTIPTFFISNPGVKEIYVLFTNIFIIGAFLLFSKKYEKRSLQSLGITFANLPLNMLIGWLLGLLLISAVFVINLLTNSISTSFNANSISWIYVVSAFFGYLVQGTMEEILCRGIIMNSVASKYNVLLGIIVNTLVFSLLHGLNPSITFLALANIFFAGLLFSLVFYLSDNIFLVGAFHAAWNFLLGPVIGIRVSGLDFYSSVFRTDLNSENSLINGGKFGFEGGLGLTIAAFVFLSIIFLVIKTKKEKYLY